jgi:hypothetical protein
MIQALVFTVVDAAEKLPEHLSLAWFSGLKKVL